MYNGKPTLSFDNIPIVVRPDWDVVIANKKQGAYPHRALLYKKSNLILGTDGEGDDMMVEAFYDKTTQENFYRVEYRAGVQYAYPDYIVAAY